MGTTKKSSSPPKVGPTGQRVMQNLRDLRGKTSVRQLSKDLAKLGRTVAATGISKIEHGERRVDCDDLVALAVALGTTPNRILFGPEVGDESVTLTEEKTVTGRQAWAWASGEKPLPSTEDRPNYLDIDALGEFSRLNRPDRPEVPYAELRAHADLLAPVVVAAQRAMAQGVSMQMILDFLSLREMLDSAARKAEARSSTQSRKRRTR